MSGAQITNLFLQDYSQAHREAIRAQAAAEGRTLSVKNPNPGAERAAKLSKQKWWKSLSRSDRTDADGAEKTRSTGAVHDGGADGKALLAVEAEEVVSR